MREHMESENTHDFDVTLETFAGHPRYEIVPTGEVYDGTEEVSRYYQETRTAFPDQRNELISLAPRRRRGDRGVLAARVRTTATSAAFPPTGKSFRVQDGRSSSCSRRTGSSTSASTSTPRRS